MQAESPHIVGIAGGSCAGKTWLADRLQSHFGDRAARLSLDSFYRDRSYLSPGRRARLNFDRPQAIDWTCVEEVLSEFCRGHAVSVPRYSFATHGRLGDDSLLNPAPILIVEGLWLFRRPAIREFFDVKIFIRSSRQLCAERRLLRDTAERGRTREQVIEQLERYTLPMFERFVAPQEKWADVVLNAPITENDVLNLVNKTEGATRSHSVGI